MNRGAVMGSLAMAGRVRRYHTWPVHRDESVAEHSWRVATIYHEVFGGTEHFDAQSLVYALRHDVLELWLGDPPFPAKTRFPGYGAGYKEAEDKLAADTGWVSQVGSNQRELIKLCDMLQMWEFGLIERAMGNQFAQPIVDDVLLWILKEHRGRWQWGLVRNWMNAVLRGFELAEID